MNLPNKLTISRIVLTFIFMFFLFSKGVLAKSLAFAAFSAASLTDFFDGYIARKYNLITDLGKLLDPIADKILLLGAFIAFVEMDIIPAWMVVIIVLRELLITGIRFLAASKGKILSASLAGKHKTVSQMISAFIILGVIIIKEAGTTTFAFWTPAVETQVEKSIYIVMIITVALTAISGLSYVFKNKSVIFVGKNN